MGDGRWEMGDGRCSQCCLRPSPTIPLREIRAKSLKVVRTEGSTGQYEYGVRRYGREKGGWESKAALLLHCCQIKGTDSAF
jgi:hypothetical protein